MLRLPGYHSGLRPSSAWQAEVDRYQLELQRSRPAMSQYQSALDKKTTAEKAVANAALLHGALAALAQQDHHGRMLAHPLESGVPLTLQSAQPSFDEAVFMAPAMPRQTSLFIYGAGHVSRALIPRLDGLEFDIFLVDIEAARFADDLGDNVTLW